MFRTRYILLITASFLIPIVSAICFVSERPLGVPTRRAGWLDRTIFRIGAEGIGCKQSRGIQEFVLLMPNRPHAALLKRCFGWPLPVLYCDATAPYFGANTAPEIQQNHEEWHPIVRLKDRNSKTLFPTIIPMKIVWIYYLLEVLICGFTIAIGTRLFAAAVQLRRRRRGLCVGCGYPITEACCSECGRMTNK